MSASLPSPNEIRRHLPMSVTATENIARRRLDVARIFDGSDPRFLLVVGPCSIHDEAAALDYAERLSREARRVGERIVVCMRVYLEKPRTSLGWKGFVHDPKLDGSGCVVEGLHRSRRLLNTIAEMGLGIATELLDPILAEYHSEFLAWAAIGARTSESQVHRELASSRPFPVGFKNATDGSTESAVFAVAAASRRHTCLGIDSEGRARVVESHGNPRGHVVLRGGKSGPNYAREVVERTSDALRAEGLCPGLVVDCSHGNSGKDPMRQGIVLDEVCRQRQAGAPTLGAMLESHLVAGRQAIGPDLRYGQSVTDACIDFETTVALIDRVFRDESRRYPSFSGPPSKAHSQAVAAMTS